MKVLRKVEFTLKLSEDEMNLLTTLLSTIMDRKELRSFEFEKDEIERAMNLFDNLNDVACL